MPKYTKLAIVLFPIEYFLKSAIDTVILEIARDDLFSFAYKAKST